MGRSLTLTRRADNGHSLQVRKVCDNGSKQPSERQATLLSTALEKSIAFE